ncbi:MAG: CoA transferase [Actinomycetota bacterium]|nr:CoA transferase [Actinomycetota bacterium]
MKPTPSDAPAVLDGVRVLCLASQFPGPFACSLLGDLGADVILVERPTGDPLRAMPWMFDAINRGARSVVIDLNSRDGREQALGLVETADVVVEGFRPGVASRLGVDFDACRAVRRELVYVSISGFGQTGPDRLLPAHDIGYQALAGLLDPELSPWPPESPNSPPVHPLADMAAGTFGALAVMAGLRARGPATFIDLSMTEALMSLAGTAIVAGLNQTGPAAVPYDPAYGAFNTADGRQVALSIAFEQPAWQALCTELGLVELAELDAWERRSRRGELQRAIADRIELRSAADLLTALQIGGVPATRVNRLRELPDDTHLTDRGVLVTIEGTTFVRQPLVIDGTAPGPRRRSPKLGEHSDELLGTLH